MKQNLRIYKSLFYSLGLAIGLLVGLFIAVESALQPSLAAAQTLTPANLALNRPIPLTVWASPASFLIQTTSIATKAYLPIIFRNPQPSFWDDFSNEKSGWPVGTDSACTSDYEGGRYQLDVKSSKECFRFAPPDEAERVFGTFEVSVYHSENQTPDALFGLYFNGDGGDKQYVFRIRPNVSTSTCSSGGQWELRRRWVESGGNKRDDLIRRTCEATLKRGYGSQSINTIRAKHTNTGQIILFINNKQVFVFDEGSDSPPELKGKGTGVYVSAPGDKSIIIKFDDFKVYTLANSP
ncbi:MAG: hypothetical protein DPW09_27890 [Anaerolineae bacterium]|nr:hypothetical protein [Anaerolineales bacterium]MCQ3977269.1 hypothetical protein [Anaerolineae bacterium]